MESVRKDIECYFGCLKQRFKMLRIPNLLKDKRQIDNMMFTIVAIQNMVLTYSLAAEEIRSWSVQLKWQYSDPQGNENLEVLVENLRLADEEDFEEEHDNRWFLPVVRKKAAQRGRWVQAGDYHERDADLSEVGLRGSLRPQDFGWDVQHIPDAEKRGEKQNVLVSHYAWFCKANPQRFWLRS